MVDSLVTSIDPRVSFWEANPAFLSIKCYKNLHDSDKSKGKTDSSQIMWAIVYLVDMSEANPWKNISEHDKKNIIKTDFLKNAKFNWDDYKELIEEYANRVLSIPERELRNFHNKLKERQTFIDDTPFSLDTYIVGEDGRRKSVKGNAELLDKMMERTGKLYSLYQDIIEKLQKERAEGVARGNRKRSASEKGLI